MDLKTERRLIAYFRNSSPFCWGLFVRPKALTDNKAYLYKNQAETYGALAQLGIPVKSVRQKYDEVTDDLIQSLGIEGIIRKIVVPQVDSLIKKNVLDDLRSCWRVARWPRTGQLAHDSPENPHAHPFIEWDRPHSLMTGWSTFAHIYFEEIEEITGRGGAR
jgi:hypothetical protein